MVIRHFMGKKSNKLLLDEMKKAILNSLKLKGIDLDKVSINLKEDENNCLNLSVCLNN